MVSEVVKKYCRGEACLIRYADDFVCAFQYQADAERLYRALGKRLGKFGLELSEEKSRVISFSREHQPGKASFDFLGVVVEIQQARVRSSLLDVETGETIRLADIPGNLIPLAPVGNGEWVGQYYTSRQPTDAVRFSLDDPRPDQVPERYHERSPIHSVGHIKGHLLIVQGLQDPNVSPENVRAVTSALQQAGVPYQLLAFEGEGHGISKPKNQKTLYLRLAEFFESAFCI